MENTNAKRLIAEFTKNYIEKVFYFCLKKTGSSHEAEDLTSDITLNIIAALKRGTIPTSFSAWVWQIAKNRYSVWADKKHKHSESVTGSDVEDYEIEDENADILNEYIHSEELQLLRRELAFISSDYRNVVVAYYIEDKSISNIAAELDLPQGTVMSKLYRARKILKEGMNMAREFGKFSYKPENVNFVKNGSDSITNEPWCYLERMLCKNILLAAYRTPSTAEELSIEIGVALPYMEEELERLVDATLMKKNGDKYETNLFIVSADAQEKIYAHLNGILPELTKAIIDAVEYETAWRNKNAPGWHGGYQPYEDMKWALLMRKVDIISDYVLSENDNNTLDYNSRTVRPRGGRWDVVGLEIYHGSGFVGLHGCAGNPDEVDHESFNFSQYKFDYEGIANKTPVYLTYAEGQALADISRGNAERVKEGVLNKLLDYGHIRKTADGYEPTFLVMHSDKLKNIPESDEEYSRIMKRANELATRHYLFCRDMIYKEIPDFLKNDKAQIDHACANVFFMRASVLMEALRTGYISYDDGDERNMLGTLLFVK